MRAYSEVYTFSEIALILKVSVETVWQWARDGKIPCAAKFGALWRFEKGAVVEWIASNAPAELKEKEFA
jgi:excisionase family DNA binding protein